MASIRSRKSDPVTLACELDGIVPVERLTNGNASASIDQPHREALHLTIPSEAFREQKDQAVAPYQALPIKGPIINITQHLTPALDVIEPQRGETTEVSFSEYTSQIAHSSKSNDDLTDIHGCRPNLPQRPNKLLKQGSLQDRIHKVIEEYKQRLTERTSVHMG